MTIQVSLPDSGYWNVCVYNQKKKLVKQEDYAQTGQKFTVKAAKGQKLYVMVKARTKSAVGKTYRVTVKQNKANYKDSVKRTDIYSRYQHSLTGNKWN